MSMATKTVPDAVRAADPLLDTPLVKDVDEHLLQRIIREPRPVPAPTRRRRASLAIAAVLSISLVGGGIAAAAQSFPDRFTDVFPWAAEHGASASPSVPLATIAGPYDSDLTYWVTSNRDGSVCLNAVQAYPGHADEPLSHTRPGTAFGACGHDFYFDAHRGYGVTDPRAVYISGRDQRAMSAAVTFPDGRTHALTVVDGWVLGWYRSEPEVTPRLTVFDEHGAVIHQARLPMG